MFTVQPSLGIATQSLICTVFLQSLVYCCQQERNTNFRGGAGEKYPVPVQNSLTVLLCLYFSVKNNSERSV